MKIISKLIFFCVLTLFAIFTKTLFTISGMNFMVAYTGGGLAMFIANMLYDYFKEL